MKIMSKSVLMLTILMMAVLTTGCLNKGPSDQSPQSEQPQVQEPSNSGTQSSAKPGQYFPLSVGASWDYQGEGNEYASFTREVVFQSENRYQTREDNGGTVSAMIYQISDDSVTRIYSEGEVYDKVNLLDKQPNENTVILKSPLQVGTKWQGAGGDREIVDINATIETPSGKFEHCIKVKVAGQDSTSFEFFKEGVGMVKREFNSGELQVSSTLKKYTPPS